MKEKNVELLKAIFSNILLFTTGIFNKRSVDQLRVFSPLTLRSRIIAILAYLAIFLFMSSIYRLVPEDTPETLLYRYNNILSSIWPFVMAFVVALVLLNPSFRKHDQRLLKWFSILGYFFVYIPGFSSVRDDGAIMLFRDEMAPFPYQVLIATAVALYFHLLNEVVSRKQQVEAEIELAQHIQQKLLPTISIQEPSHEIYGRSISANEVGGDYFDVVPLDPMRHAVAIGDVSGHNMGASMVMAMVKSAFRTELRLTHDAESLVTALNQTICENTDRRTFVTFAYGLFDFSSRMLTYIGAGHLPLLQYVYSTGEIVEHRTPNLGLGLLHNATFTAIVAPFSSNDVFLFLTDGVIEARNSDDEEFGMERVYPILIQQKEQSAELVYERLMEDLKLFTRIRPLEDDITVVVVIS